MEPSHAFARSRFLMLVVALFLQPSLAVGQGPMFPAGPRLTPEARRQLAQATRDATLAPWQRDFMLAVAHDGTSEPSAIPTDLAPRLAAFTAADGAWTGMPPPVARYDHAAIYDPVRDRMLVFGGYDGSERNDLWALSLGTRPAWTALAPAGDPPTGRDGLTAIYDPVRDRMLVFGGFDGGARSDVWALSLAGSPAWAELAVAGGPPPGRYNHAAIYDPVRDRMLVFGGVEANFTYRNDVWALSLAGSPAWNALAPAGGPPTARGYHTAIYDPLRDRMLVFGGFDGGLRNDVWALSLAGGPAWNALAPTGGPPAARHSHAAIYDPVGDRMMVFGGYDGGERDDTWALSLAAIPTWTALAPAGDTPAARDGATAILDPLRHRMIVFAGTDGGDRSDTHALSLAGIPTWNELAPGGSPPTPCASGTAILDPVRARMLVFGGLDDTLGCRNDVWALSDAGTQAWSRLVPAGSPPPAREAHTAIYDPVRDRMLVFGGRDRSFHYWNDVWELALAGSPTWNKLSPAGTPPSARYAHSAIYDPVQDRMVVFGGNDGGAFRNDVWALSLAGSSAWSKLEPTGSPPAARIGHTAIFDPVDDRMIVFGGGAGSRLNDVWALSLSGSPAWSALAPAGTPPPARMEHTAIHDPVRHRMVVFGGTGPPLFHDVWALSLAGSPAWSELAPGGTPPTPRADHTAIYDPARERMVVFGGYDFIIRSDVGTLLWGGTVSVAGNLPESLRLDAPWPNPSRHETVVDFELRAPGRVVLDVFDLQGRRVKRILDDWFPAGRHASAWRGEDDRGRAVESGVYFLRMRAGGSLAIRRTVRVR